MKEIDANADLDRFLTGASKYAAYLETPEGRLGLDLAFANLQEHLPATSPAVEWILTSSPVKPIRAAACSFHFMVSFRA